MIALLYAATAAALLLLVHRFVTPLSRGAAVVLFLLPLVFTGRAVLTGRIYAPVELPYDVPPLADYRQELRVPPPQNPMLTDIAFILIPWREAVRQSVMAGEWPLLNRFELCGEPLAAAMQPAVYSPFTWIALLLPSAVSFTYTASMAFFIAGLGAFLLARELGRSEIAALIAAAIFAFSAPMALQILWPLGFAWGQTPLLLVGMRRAVVGHQAGLLTIALAMQVVAGHPETLLHSVAIAGVYGLFLLRHWRGAVAVVAAGVLALLLTAVALLPFLEAAPQSGEHMVRSKLYAGNPLRVAPGSVKAAVLGDLFPFTRGATPLPRAEAGSVALALALVAVVRVRSRETWFFAGLLVFALLAGINAWPVAQTLHALPLFKVALNDRLVSAVPLCLAILAAFALDEVLPVARCPLPGDAQLATGNGQRATRWIPLALLVAIAAASPWSVDRLRLAAEIVPLAALIFVRKPQFVLALILGQRVLADGALVPTHRREIAYPPLPLFASLANVKEPFRIIAPGQTLVPDIATMYGLEDARGATAMTFAPLAVPAFPIWPAGDLTKPMLSMMNVRYAVTGAADPIPPGWHHVTVDHQSRLIENERVLPRAYVPRYTRTGEMDPDADPAGNAWVDGAGDGPNGPGVVTVRREGSKLHITADMAARGYVVISETAWHGWRGYLDGRRVKLLRANQAFLAVYVPEGHHEVRLRYLPQSFVVGRTISVAVALLLAVALLIRQVV
jgi:hypothetical protein